MVVTNTRIILDDEIIGADALAILKDKVRSLVTETFVIYEQEVRATITR